MPNKAVLLNIDYKIDINGNIYLEMTSSSFARDRGSLEMDDFS